jgi:hypothetical protein
VQASCSTAVPLAVEPGRGPVIVAVMSSQVCPGTVEVGSANGGPVTPNWPGSGGNTPKPSSIAVPFGDRPGMKPVGIPPVNMAWMWGALLAANMAAWLHQLTAVTAGEDILAGHGVRSGKAMIATLRRRLIAVPGRLTRHARHLVLRLPPGHHLLPEILTRLRQLPAPA